MSPDFCPEHGGICQEMGEMRSDLRNIDSKIDRVERTLEVIQKCLKRDAISNKVGQIMIWAAGIGGGAFLIEAVKQLLSGGAK